jgi:hypothetical protein
VNVSLFILVSFVLKFSPFVAYLSQFHSGEIDDLCFEFG